MNDVFDINNMPERRLSIRKMISIDQRMSLGDAIRIVKRNMAMQLATKIIEGDKFFWERTESAGGLNLLEYGADCIVLTTEEVSILKRESFKDGMRCSQGFMVNKQ